MAQQHLNFGTAPAGTDGDTLRTALGKVEANTTELYTNVANNAAAIASNTSQLTITQALKNKLINGNFDFWWRGTNFAPAANETKTADRWKVQQAGTTINVSQQAFVFGQTSVPNNPKYFARCATTTSAGAGNFALFAQVIENVTTCAGQQVTISFWAKADANRNVGIELGQSFGSGGAPSAFTSTPVGAAALTPLWQKFVFTITVPSVAGKVVGTSGTDGLLLYFWLDAGSSFAARASNIGQQSGTFDIAQVQLEVGATASAFDLRHPSVELAFCKRFSQPIYGTGMIGIALSSTNIYFTAQLKVPMRASPSITLLKTSFAAGSYEICCGNWLTNSAASLSAPAANTEGFDLQLAGFSGLVTNTMAVMNLPFVPVFALDAEL